MSSSSRSPARYLHSVIAHIMVADASEAIDFYRNGFGATEVLRIAAADGTVVHAEIAIEDSVVMLGDGSGPFTVPSSLGGTSVGLHVYVADVDAMTAAAGGFGAEILQAPQDMFYGDRSAILRDPFGHVWVLLTCQEELGLSVIRERGEALLAGQLGGHESIG